MMALVIILTNYYKVNCGFQNIQSKSLTVCNAIQPDIFIFCSGNVPHICGGALFPGAGGPFHHQHQLKCYRYLPNSDTWEESGTLANTHYASGFVNHNDLGLVMAGSYSGNTHQPGDGNKTSHTIDGEIIQV